MYRKVTANVSKAFASTSTATGVLFTLRLLIFTQQQRDLQLSVGCDQFTTLDYGLSLWLRERLLYEAAVGFLWATWEVFRHGVYV